MFVTLSLMDRDDNVWWEMPEGMAEHLLSTDDSDTLAGIAREIRDAYRNADEQASSNS